MPGWWFTIESTTTRHFIQQLKIAVENALRSKPDVRAIMRARATKQRFPVKQWVEDLEKLQSSAIEISHKQAAMEKRPALRSPSTATILETPGLLRVLQSRFMKPTLRPRPAVVQPPNPSKVLSTISEAHPRSGIAQASDQDRTLSSFSEGRLLAGSGPGLGSKMGPSSRRKRPPPPLLRTTTNAVKVTDFAAIRKQGDDESTNKNQRPPIPHSSSSSSLRTKANDSERERTGILKRPAMSRSQTQPQLAPNDKKAVRLLGMQLSARRASELISPTDSSPSNGESSTQVPSSPESPATPSTGYYTPPPSRMSVSFQSDSTAATSVSSASSADGDNSCWTAASTNAGRFPTGASSVHTGKHNIIQSPHAVDSFPSLGPHFFPHGSIPVLSTSDVKGEKPDNILQNVTPFFSDPEKVYEAKFKQKLKRLNGKNSESQLCIEEYLLNSEKSWFGKLRAAELRKASMACPAEKQSPEVMAEKTMRKKAREEEFGLGNDYKPPTGLNRILRMKIGNWPVYSFLLAFVRDIHILVPRRNVLLTSNDF